MTKLSAAAIALLASSAFIAAAQANDSFRTTTNIDVFYGDLNLDHPAGAEKMMHRINRAAVRACGGTPDSRDLRERHAFRQCVTTATANAVRQLNAPLVTALFFGRSATDPRVAAR